MFEVSSKKIDPVLCQQELADPVAGGFVVFEGWVRDHNEGRSVDRLEYEVYHELAINEARKIIQEAKELYDIRGLKIVHREGLLEIGDIAVWIGVNAKHRDAAYRASRFLIDEIKSRLPIWKREHYSSGEKEWVNCHGCMHHHSLHFDEKDYYKQQINLIGDQKQKSLLESRVLIVGLGGLGSPVADYLARAGVGNLTLMDDDKVDASNLARQTLYTYKDIGLSKAEMAKQRLYEVNPNGNFTALPLKFEIEKHKSLMTSFDLVIECSDNFRTKYMVHDACLEESTPLVMASVYKWDGWLQSFLFEKDEPCFRCIYPDQPIEACTMNCADAGVVGTVPGALGVLQAQMAIELLIGDRKAHSGKKYLYDAQNMSLRSLSVSKREDCPLCSVNRCSMGAVKDYHPERLLEVSWQDVSERMMQMKPPVVLDVRDTEEQNTHSFNAPWELVSAPGADINIVQRFAFEDEIYLVCAQGKRSLRQASRLREQGYKHVFSVKGGMSEAGHKSF